MSTFSDENTGNGESVQDRPPFTVDLLADEFRRHKRLPHQIPRDPMAAANWWIKHQKPAHENIEVPRLARVIGKNSVSRWMTPYADRLIASLRKFVTLSKHEQEFIISAVDDGVFYNGDEFAFFHQVYEETQKMRSVGVDAYRQDAAKNLKAFISGAGGR